MDPCAIGVTLLHAHRLCCAGRWVQSGVEKLLQSPYSDGAAVCAFVSHEATVTATTQHRMVAQVHSAKDLKAHVLVRRAAIGALVVGRFAQE